MKTKIIALAITFVSAILFIGASSSIALSNEQSKTPSAHQFMEEKEVMHVGMGENQPL